MIKMYKKVVEDMLCNNCNHQLPNDSEFCQFCGRKLKQPVEQPQSLDKQLHAPTDVLIGKPSQTEAVIKDTKNDKPYANFIKMYYDCFCKTCGVKVNSSAKECHNCGKQFSKLSNRIALYSLAIIVILISISFNVYQYEEHNMQIFVKDLTISAQETEISDLKKDNDTMSGNMVDLTKRVNFFDKHIRFMGRNSIVYHKYGCENFDINDSYALDIDTAKAVDFSACRHCK